MPLRLPPAVVNEDSGAGHFLLGQMAVLPEVASGDRPCAAKAVAPGVERTLIRTLVDDDAVPAEHGIRRSDSRSGSHE